MNTQLCLFAFVLLEAKEQRVLALAVLVDGIGAGALKVKLKIKARTTWSTLSYELAAQPFCVCTS